MLAQRIRIHISTLLAGVLAVMLAAAPMMAQRKGKTLYERLGRYDAIAAVVDDFIGRMVSDTQLGRFFVGLSDNSKKRVRQLVVDQLCEAAGGPCFYLGRDMKTAHQGANISDTDWQTAAKHLAATLDKFKAPQKEKDEVLALVTSLKGDIVKSQ